MPDFLPAWLLLVFLIALLILVWQLFGRGPRRRRLLRRSQQLLAQNNWQQALQLLQPLTAAGRSGWQRSVRQLQGECHKAAMESAIQEKSFEAALSHALQAAELLQQKDSDARRRVAEAMLTEVRAGFAATAGARIDALLDLISRTMQVQPDCREALFWQALCQLRQGKTDLAIAALRTAQRGDDGNQAANASIDPPLYLGSLLFRQSQAREAIRYLAQANRIDGNCPFVLAQLGMAMLDGSGDVSMAVRALQKALGTRGFEQWSRSPQRAWIEGFPKDLSYVRKLAEKHAFVCPIWGADFRSLKRQGGIALGRGLYHLGQFRDSGQVFDTLLQEGAPSLPVLRGLGLALARQGEYDRAYKHLRMAHDMEPSQDRLTAGYLALCGAKGKPTSHEAKIKNIAWAIRLLNQFTAPGDVEWATLVSEVFAEARALQIPPARDDQLYLCEHLASVNATDPLAADAYDCLIGTYPEVVRDEYAWLYARATQIHGLTGLHAMELLARAFADRDRAEEFFAQRDWDLEAAELTYLERAAAMAPGHFPASLGQDYATRGQTLLLQHSRRLEEAGDLDAALASAEIFFKLAPESPAAHDRLAALRYRRADAAQAVELLWQWHRLRTDDPTPLIRLAIIKQEQGDAAGCLDRIQEALARSQGTRRAQIAFLGARLALKSDPTQQSGDRPAFALLEECLAHDPGHVQARWCLAALHAAQGDEQALSKLATSMDQPDVGDPRFHFLAAVANLVKANFPATREAAQRAREAGQSNPSAGLAWKSETAYLSGCASALMGDLQTARETLQVSAEAPECSSGDHAKALLAEITFSLRDYDNAAQWWRSIDPEKRNAWKLSGTLAGAVFMAALVALQRGSYEEAAEKLREAGRLGWRDRRLGPLLALALVKAGQRCLYASLQ